MRRYLFALGLAITAAACSDTSGPAPKLAAYYVVDSIDTQAVPARIVTGTNADSATMTAGSFDLSMPYVIGICESLTIPSQQPVEGCAASTNAMTVTGRGTLEIDPLRTGPAVHPLMTGHFDDTKLVLEPTSPAPGQPVEDYTAHRWVMHAAASPVQGL